MIRQNLLESIETALNVYNHQPFYNASKNLIETLGYSSSKTFEFTTPDFYGFDSFAQASPAYANLKKDKLLPENWVNAHFLNQITDDDLAGKGDTIWTGIDASNITSYLFMAIELKPDSYSSSKLSQITREINKLFPLPMLVIYKVGNLLSLAIINRRQNKRDETKHVLEKVSLIKDINLDKPHRAHKEILSDLSLQGLSGKGYKINSFSSLHKAWSEVLSISALNKKFFDGIMKWYLWACKEVKFPQVRPEEDIEPDEVFQSQCVIRMFTRVLFCWFLKEKSELVPSAFFRTDDLQNLLKGFNPTSNQYSYYQAILQNLFFATLSVPKDDRQYLKNPHSWGNPNYGNPHVFRYEDYFVNTDDALVLFEAIPFLNGGLFDCLDRKPEGGNPEVRIDGFSSKEKKQAKVPNKLFWGTHTVDLSKELDSPKKNAVEVKGLYDHFSQFVFTIEENTPITEEVALDPELLGMAFENLLAYYNPETNQVARKQTGSFYTPRPIVEYIVHECLQEWLYRQCQDIGIPDYKSKVQSLLFSEDASSPFEVDDAKKLVEALDKCSIFDPACGSGAFLMTTLNKLVEVLHRLDPENVLWLEMIIQKLPSAIRETTKAKLSTESLDYQRKLGLIQQCIYGVDIQPIAIQISKLRFFLALLIEQDTSKDVDANRGVLPLPNLEFKLVAANTLVMLPSHIEVATEEENEVNEIDLKDPYFKTFAQKAEEYFLCHLPDVKKDIVKELSKAVDDKVKAANSMLSIKLLPLQLNAKQNKATKAQIYKLQTEIKLWKSYHKLFNSGCVGFFEPCYFFPEVKNGFSIIVGNPPYIQLLSSMIKEHTDMYSTMGYQVFERSSDIYCLFFERSHNLLANKGVLGFITSNKWMRAGYGVKLRDFFTTENRNVLRIIDFGGNLVFDSATVDTAITIISREPSIGNAQGVSVPKGYDNEASLFDFIKSHSMQVQLPIYGNWVIGKNEAQALKQLLDNMGRPLMDWEISIYRGLITGLNEAFIVDTPTKDMLCSQEPSSSSLFRPLLRGRDIKSYNCQWAGVWLIATGYDINIPKHHPAVYDYLKQFESRAMSRDDKGKNWWNLRACTYYNEFEKKKIIYPNMTKYLPFVIDTTGMYCNQKCFILTATDDNVLEYMTGFFNSKVAQFWIRHACPELLGGTRELSKVFFQEIPIPEVQPENSSLVQEVSKLVTSIHDKTKAGKDTQEERKRIDDIFYCLYGLSQEDIGLVESFSNEKLGYI